MVKSEVKTYRNSVTVNSTTNTVTLPSFSKYECSTVCPQKSEPLNTLQQQPQICSDLNKILHTQDDICYKHYYIVSYKSALTLLKYEFLNNITHKPSQLMSVRTVKMFNPVRWPIHWADEVGCLSWQLRNRLMGTVGWTLSCWKVMKSPETERMAGSNCCLNSVSL